jgi:peptide/nickel transport system permease protein
MEVLKFIAKRLLNGLLVMLGVIVVIFVLFSLTPDPARLTLGQRADSSSVEAIRKQFRLNLPWYSRLGLYVNDLSPVSFHNLQDDDASTFISHEDVSFVKLFTAGNTTMVIKPPYLGRSFQNREKVSDIILDKVFATFLLALSAMALASLIGIVLGVFAALKKNTFWDNAILTFSTLGISQPSYFAAMLLAMIFGYYLADYTGLNLQGGLKTTDLLGDNTIYQWKNMLLPMIALGIRPIAIIAQLTRSAMLDEMSQDYVRTAKAKGLSSYVVIFKHALRNAMNPVVTSISGWLAAVLTGAYFVEHVFSYNGLGSKTIESLLSFDFPVVMGLSLFVASIFVVMNIVTDILYSVLDPRVVIKG